MVGDLELTALSDGWLDVPAATFAPRPPGTAPDDPVRLGANAWIVRAPGRVVLIDAGAGDTLRDGFPDVGRLTAALAETGLRATDVTEIVLTHMHPDHVGGLTTADGRRRFPNATLRVHAAEWRFWSDRSRVAALPRAQRAVADLTARLVAHLDYPVELVEGQADLGDGLYLPPLPGHSPGHSIVRLASGSALAALIGDAMICGPMQMRRPEISYALDADPAQAARSRIRLLDMLATDGIPFAATHLETLALGRAMPARGGGWNFVPA